MAEESVEEELKACTDHAEGVHGRMQPFQKIIND
jgi:hypothetical protein